MTRLVFVDVDDTLFTPPYAAVKRVATLLGKNFPPEDDFINRPSIHFHEAFPQVFSSATQMWAMAFLSLPLGYFKSHNPTPLDIEHMSLILRDPRVYLISKNPPSFTRWRVQRLAAVFKVNIGDRYVACGPIFKKGPTKLEVMQKIATARGTTLKDCVLIDDSPENIREAAGAGMLAAMIRCTWNKQDVADLQARTPPVDCITTEDIPTYISSYLSDEISTESAPQFIVPPLTPLNALRMAWVFMKRRFLYGEPLPRLSQIIPLARNPWTSFLHADPHKKVTQIVERCLAHPSHLAGIRILSLRHGAVMSLLPLNLQSQLTGLSLRDQARAFRAACKQVCESRGERFVADAQFFFEGLDRGQEIARLLSSNAVRTSVQVYASTHHVELSVAEGLAKRNTSEITASRTYLGCRLGQWCLDTVVRRSFKKVHLEVHPSVKALENDHFLLYASTHRSYLDSGILYAVLAASAQTYPYIVAADKMRKMWLGKLGVIAGALFLQRKFVDVIYAAILAEHVGRMQDKGSSLEVFLEGQRSRSGLTLQPKKGIASIVWQNIQAANPEKSKVAIVPVAFAYNKLPESELLIRESFEERQKSGRVSLRETSDIKIKAKKRKSKAQTIRSIVRRLRSAPVSECYINFAAPIVLERVAADSPKEDSARLQRQLNDVMFCINASTMALPTSVLCLGVLGGIDHHMSRADAAKFLDLTRALLALYQLPCQQILAQETPIDAHIDSFLALPFVNRKFKRHRIDERDVLSIADLDIQRASYYQNNVLHFFVLPAILSYIFLESRTGRVEELHRFFDQMVAKLRIKYFLPPAIHAKTFIDDLLKIFDQRQMISVKESAYIVNLHGADTEMLQLLGRVGGVIMQNDAPDILEVIRRSYQRVDVDLQSQLVSLTCGAKIDGEVLGLSDVGFFLRCEVIPQVGDRVSFTSHQDAAIALEGTVIRCEFDGVAVQRAPSLPVPRPAERRMAARTAEVIKGTFSYNRTLKEESEITNLSPSGAFIVTDLAVREGDVLACNLQDNGAAICVRGKVTRTSETGVGVQFQGMTAEDRARLLLLLSNVEKARLTYRDQVTTSASQRGD
jgi:hypothetical protein